CRLHDAPLVGGRRLVSGVRRQVRRLEPPKAARVRTYMRPVAWTLATWFGCGCIPRAPGTAGAIGAIPLYLAAAHAGGRTAVALTACVVTLAGVWAASVVAREVGKKDPQIVVIDEVAGMLVTMLPANEPSWRAVA